MNELIIELLSKRGVSGAIDDDRIKVFEDGTLVELNDDSLLALSKEAANKRIKVFAESIRKKVTGEVPPEQLSTYQINSDVINLVNCWCIAQEFSFSGLTEKQFNQAITTIDPLLVSKMQIEVDVLNLPSLFVLFQTWIAKRGAFAIASAWVEALEKATMAQIENADINQIEDVLEVAEQQALSKLQELT